MKTLIKIGPYLFLDSVDIDKCLEDECDHSSSHDSHDHANIREMENDFHLESCVEMFYSSYGFNWPYFSFGTKECEVFIYNAFNPSFV
jgi:hypothetical protein